MPGVPKEQRAASNVPLAQDKATTLPSIRSNVKFTNSARPVSRAMSSNGRRYKRGEKHGEFDPDKLATELRYKQLQEIFNETTDGLTIEEFKIAMRKTVGQNMTDDEIEFLFLKVDDNCDEHVDWEEYVTYNLLEYQGKMLMVQMMRETPFPPETTKIPSLHRDLIVTIDYYPLLRKREGRGYIDYTKGRYLTLSREGLVSVWNIKMKQINSFNTISDIVGDRSTQPWLVDLACMYNVGMVAVSSTDRDITIFDMQSRNFPKRYYLTGLNDCITCMSYWVDLNNLNHAILSVGDTSGSICVLVFEQCLRGGPFVSFGGRSNTLEKISLPEVIRGFYKGVRGYRFNQVHKDWVLRVNYIPELTSILSCSQTNDTSLCLHEFGKKKKQCSFFKVYKGILCFDYCPRNNFIVTGGMDYWIRVWNPYVYSKPIFILKGHLKPISHVIVNSRKNQIIGVDKGRNIRVYDMKDQACVQHLSGRLVRLGKIPLSAVCFNPVLQTLIIATNQLAILEKVVKEEQVVEIKSHNKPVISALYNKTFNFVVSACQDSVISVWNLYSGEKIIQAINAHTRVEKGVEVPVEITAMTFDIPQRRVITGARDGSIKVWNFNNGNCMQSFHTPDGLEITGIASSHHKIFTAGWSRRVHTYIDGLGEEHRKDWKKKHNEDILCLSYLSPNIIATGSYDGDVVVWSRDTGHVYCILNASKSVKSIVDTKPVMNTDGQPETNDCSVSIDGNSSPLTFENIAIDELIKARKASLPKKNADVLNRVKENVSLKENKRSPKSNHMTDSPIEHPILPLFRSEQSCPTRDHPTRRQEYDELCKLYESAVECILFLETRDRESGETAIIMTSGAEGWIRAWSIHYEGGLLGQFNAAHEVGESVHTMTTDEKNQYMFTGDSLGYVKIWDLSDYCTRNVLSKKQRALRWRYLKETFTYMRFAYPPQPVPDVLISTERKPMNIDSRPPPATSMPKTTLKWPWLVSSYRAHTKIINKIEYVERYKLLITASSDCSIRVWTLNGVYIGTFGESWISISKLLEQLPTEKKRIPPDLQRIGSASTLKVLNHGKSGLWKIALNGAKKITQSQADEYDQEPSRQGVGGITSPGLASEGRETPRSGPTGLPKIKNTGGSEILGKSYKKTRRHIMPPKMDKFVEMNSSISVYRCLPFSELSAENDPEQKKVLDDLRVKYLGGSLLARMRGEISKGPGFMGLYKKITSRPPLPKGKNQAGRIKRVQNKVQKKSDSFFADLTIKENPLEKDLIDKIIEE